jgi:hypothetical protein
MGKSSGKDNALGCQAVQVRRFEMLGAVETNPVGPQSIDGNKEQVEPVS